MNRETSSMASSKSDRSSPSQQGEKDTINELKSNGRWAAGITVLSVMYGEMTVARQLPVDPRQESWVLMRSPLPGLALSLLYVAVVTWWGPLFMASRKPLTARLRNLMIAYNAFQVAYSAWLFYQGGVNGWFFYKFICQPCDFSDNPQAVGMMHAAFWYYMSKFIDFIDTFFFVLNKKYEHISVLHVSHHALMPASLWYGVRYQAGGHATLMGFINSFVHVVMYLYYLLAAMGPRVRPFLWWKKYLTTLQMVQFTIVFFHAISLAFVECEVPPAILRWESGIAVMFFVLFANFYIKAYRKREKNKAKGDGNIIEMPGLSKMCYIHPPREDRREMSHGTHTMSNGVPNDVPNGKVEGASEAMNGASNGDVRLRGHIGQEAVGTSQYS